ncbi:Cache sensor signal transduction histidine kinase [Desulfuromusa kysingii]|uniref:histidine kinase n=1 Tax=Desulfuromusa kysingii TaxID=37625 RepID=A0A1H3XF27_9BACT|nr:cache domain-containing protein [Desulfuromusa kysingii]SDZ97222.1 Cache sensor signal transduction histidine kinase [Desulfuromusa kysingii]
MIRNLFAFFNNLKIRWKMLVITLPLLVFPIFLLGGMIGYIATTEAYKGIIDASKADLDHMASFTLDLLDGHHRQFEVYREDKKKTVRQEMKTLVELAYTLINEQQHQYDLGNISLSEAQQSTRNSFKDVSIGSSGYLFAVTSKGELRVHPTREGENIISAKDKNGRLFIRELAERALNSKPGEVLYTIYPWRNETLGDKHPRNKIVAFRYYPQWDWIVAAGGYLDETYDDPEFEQQSLITLSQQIKSKKVGITGYVYCMTSDGVMTIHPDAEGQSLISEQDTTGHKFIAEMTEKKDGWIRYPWLNKGDKKARMKIVRYRYFAPWDWIIAVSSYEDEFYQAANNLKWRIAGYVLLLPILIGVVATLLLFLASKVMTDPIHKMITVIRRVKQGRLDEQVPVTSHDEIGELAISFNRMTRILKKNKELEATLAQQGKMASLGVLSSGVAHEINNPLGVILGYAGHLEKKITPEDPNYAFIHEIKRESKRCKKIVQNLLSYSRTPRPVLEPTDINRLLSQIIDFASNHSDLFKINVIENFSTDIPKISADMDQLRQVTINLLLNAASASAEGGEIRVATGLDGDQFVRIEFSDDGEGISEENLEKIFEPFFTTKTKGTGLGLAITKQIIEMHQGEIFIDSETGKGTTVVIRLPLTREEY